MEGLIFKSDIGKMLVVFDKSFEVSDDYACTLYIPFGRVSIYGKLSVELVESYLSHLSKNIELIGVLERCEEYGDLL